MTWLGFCYIVESNEIDSFECFTVAVSLQQKFCVRADQDVSQAFAQFSENWIRDMAEGIIKRVTDKGFGFIEDGSDKDMFFHSSAVEGCSFDELREGQKVSFNVGQGPKGPRADNVRVI